MALTAYNEIELRKAVNKALSSPQSINRARFGANSRYKNARIALFDALYDHPISKELQNKDFEGSDLIDHGNLFSFIGFNHNDEPVNTLRDYFSRHIKMNPNPKLEESRNKFRYIFTVKYPSQTEIYHSDEFSTPDHWSSRTWIQIIEEGVGNAARYVFNLSGDLRKAGSRSWFGLQIEKDRSQGGSFTPKPYIKEILEAFEQYFER